jgi:hypothetical protein
MWNGARSVMPYLAGQRLECLVYCCVQVPGLVQWPMGSPIRFCAATSEVLLCSCVCCVLIGVCKGRAGQG